MVTAELIRAASKCGCNSCRQALSQAQEDEQERESFRYYQEVFLRRLDDDDFLARTALFESGVIGRQMVGRISRYGCR